MRLNPEIRQDRPPGGGGNGNGGLVKHRLEELERRMTRLEEKVDTLAGTCTRIDTKMDDIASKSYVLRAFGYTAALLVVTVVGHLLIRTLQSVPPP